MRQTPESRSRITNGDNGSLLISLDKDNKLLSGKRFMASSIKMKKGPLITIVLSVLVLAFIYVTWSRSAKLKWAASPVELTKDKNKHYSEWPAFTLPDRVLHNSVNFFYFTPMFELWHYF